MFNQFLYDFKRKSNNHCGSFFFFEMNRMMSSFKPFGAESASRSVTNPHLYSPPICSSKISFPMIKLYTIFLVPLHLCYLLVLYSFLFLVLNYLCGEFSIPLLELVQMRLL